MWRDRLNDAADGCFLYALICAALLGILYGQIKKLFTWRA
jgi:hypothetical protein